MTIMTQFFRVLLKIFGYACRRAATARPRKSSSQMIQMLEGGGRGGGGGGSTLPTSTVDSIRQLPSTAFVASGTEHERVIL